MAKDIPLTIEDCKSFQEYPNLIPVIPATQQARMRGKWGEASNKKIPANNAPIKNKTGISA